MTRPVLIAISLLLVLQKLSDGADHGQQTSRGLTASEGSLHWRGEITSASQLMKLVRHASRSNRVCVVFRLPVYLAGAKDPLVESINMAADLAGMTGGKLAIWQCQVSYMYQVHGVLSEIMPRQVPSITCYVSLLDVFSLPLPRSTEEVVDSAEIANWLSNISVNVEADTLLVHPVDERIDMDACVADSQACVVLYLPHLSLHPDTKRIIDDIMQLRQDLQHHTEWVVATSLHSGVSRIIGGDEHMTTRPGVWLYDTAYATLGRPSMKFDLTADGVLRFHLHILMSAIAPQVLTEDNFPTDVLSSSHSWVVLFINCNSDLGRVNAAISHAHDLNQTAHALQQSEEAHLKFGIVDTACSKKIIADIVEVKLLKSLPLVLLFRHEPGTKEPTHRQLNVPLENLTPSGILSILRETTDRSSMDVKFDPRTSGHVNLPPLGLLLGGEDTGTMLYLDGMLNASISGQCLVANTNVCPAQDAPAHPPLSSGKLSQVDGLGKGVVTVDSTSWSSLFHLIMETPDVQDTMKMTSSQVIVAIFTRTGCSNCERKEVVLKEVAEAYQLNDYIYFALVNCSAGSSEEICSRFSIQETYGFPAVMAWRSLHTGSADEAECETQPTDASQTSEASWLHVDYHSAISVNGVSQWLEELIQPAVEEHEDKEDSTQELIKGLGDEGPAVALHAVVEDITTWHRNNIPTYSLACFRSVCRHLFGIARCSASIRRLDRKGRQSKSKEDEWRRMHIVSKVVFARRDGETATLFRSGHAVNIVMERESSPNLHHFHQSHSYNLPADFHCEDSASICSHYMVRFTRDHSRLPVMPLSYTNFHMSRTLDSLVTGDADADLPFLVLLYSRELEVEKEGVTGQKYTEDVIQALEDTAKRYYDKVKVVTLDADALSSWADLFVPKGYFSRYDTNPLPRLCWVTSGDHHHAAFYPPLGISTGSLSPLRVPKELLAEVLGKFIEERKSLWETESF